MGPAWSGRHHKGKSNLRKIRAPKTVQSSTSHNRPARTHCTGLEAAAWEEDHGSARKGFLRWREMIGCRVVVDGMESPAGRRHNRLRPPYHAHRAPAHCRPSRRLA